MPLLRFEGFDQNEDLGGHCVVELRGLGQGSVAAAGDDGLEDADEGEEPRGVRVGGELLEPRGGLGCVAGEQWLGDRKGEATIEEVVLAAVTAVGEVAGDGLVLRLGSGRGVAGGRLDLGEDGPSRPRRGRVAERRLAFDRAANLLPRLVETEELSKGEAEVVPRAAFARRVADLDVLVYGLPEKGNGFFGAA